MCESWTTADETASELLRREFALGEIVEVSVPMHMIADTILKFGVSFFCVHEDGVMIHVSTGNTLHWSLRLSGLQTTHLSLNQPLSDGRVKCCTVHNVHQVLDLTSLCQRTLESKPTLLLLECQLCLLLAGKSSDGSISEACHISDMFRSFNALAQTQNVIVVWITADTKLGSQAPSYSNLRDATKLDSLASMWREHIGRVVRPRK